MKYNIMFFNKIIMLDISIDFNI